MMLRAEATAVLVVLEEREREKRKRKNDCIIYYQEQFDGYE